MDRIVSIAADDMNVELRVPSVPPTMARTAPADVAWRWKSKLMASSKAKPIETNAILWGMPTEMTARAIDSPKSPKKGLAGQPKACIPSPNANEQGLWLFTRLRLPHVPHQVDSKLLDCTMHPVRDATELCPVQSRPVNRYSGNMTSAGTSPPHSVSRGGGERRM